MSARNAAGPPLPPPELMAYVGHESEEARDFHYVLVGEVLKQTVLEMLGPGWSWDGRRVLDFGCGSGRLLRQFLEEAEVGEFHGSDINSEQAGWAREHLCPPIASVAVNGAAPPLPYPDAHFDVITATSVFTHIAEGWSDWLLELRRILKPDGTLIATFLDAGCSGKVPLPPPSEDAAGMTVYGFHSSEIDLPNVLHSRWWLEEHWGRAFEFLELRQAGSDTAPDAVGHGTVALRPRDGALTAADLERERPGEDRYLAARRYQYQLLRAEGEQYRRGLRGGLARRARQRLRRRRDN